MHNFKELSVWSKSIDLVEFVYTAIRDFPKEEQFGLTNQARRSASSVPSNIAEGAGRNSVKEFKYFLAVAKGSLNELQTQFIIAQKLGYVSNERLYFIEEKINEISKMIMALSKSLK